MPLVEGAQAYADHFDISRDAVGSALAEYGSVFNINEWFVDQPTTKCSGTRHGLCTASLQETRRRRVSVGGGKLWPVKKFLGQPYFSYPVSPCLSGGGAPHPTAHSQAIHEFIKCHHYCNQTLHIGSHGV